MASRLFAVDLGAWSVKLAIASPGIRGATLLNVVERLVPPGEAPIEQRVKLALASAIDELKLRDESGYIGVYGDQVFTQVLEFSFKHLRRSDLDKAVGGELEGVVPVDLEDMVYCFEPIPNAPALVPEGARGRVAPPPEGMRVLSYAMRRDRAEQLLEVGKQAGFNPRGLLACGGAAAKLVERTPSLMKARTDGAVAVIDIGHERTDVVVVHAGKAVFSRSVARAGKHVTQAIASHWKLDFASAERAKHADGFVASQAEPATSEAWSRIHQVTVTELTPFARDIRQTLAACRAKTGFAPLAAILVGGGARLRGLGSFLTEQLGLPTWRLTAEDVGALAGPKLVGNATSPPPGASPGGSVFGLPIDSAALTVGMAYDAAGGRPQFDLHAGSGGSLDFSFIRQKAVPLGVSVLAVAAFAAFSAYADLYKLKKNEKTLNTRLAAETTEMYGSSKTASEVLNSSGASGGGGALSPVPKMTAYDLLLEFNSHIPPKDKITLDVDKLEIDNEKVDVSGTVKTPEELDALVSELKKSDCFKDIQRGPTDTLDNGVRKFRLTMPVKCM